MGRTVVLCRRSLEQPALLRRGRNGLHGQSPRGTLKRLQKGNVSTEYTEEDGGTQRKRKGCLSPRSSASLSYLYASLTLYLLGVRRFPAFPFSSLPFSVNLCASLCLCGYVPSLESPGP